MVSRSRHQAPERRSAVHARTYWPTPSFLRHCVIGAPNGRAHNGLCNCESVIHRHASSLRHARGPILRLIRIVRAASPLRRSRRIGMIQLIGPIESRPHREYHDILRRFMTILLNRSAWLCRRVAEESWTSACAAIGIEDSNAYERYVCGNAPSARPPQRPGRSPCPLVTVVRSGSTREGGCLPGRCATAQRCG